MPTIWVVMKEVHGESWDPMAVLQQKNKNKKRKDYNAEERGKEWEKRQRQF